MGYPYLDLADPQLLVSAVPRQDLGVYANMTYMRLPSVKYDLDGNTVAANKDAYLLEHARLLRMRAKIIAMNNPNPLIIEVRRFLSRKTNTNPINILDQREPPPTDTLSEPLETLTLPASHFTSWDPTSNYPGQTTGRRPGMPRMPGDTDHQNQYLSKEEFESIPLTTIEFSGNIILDATSSSTRTEYQYCLVFRESGPLNTDPPGSYAMYRRSDNGYYDRFSGPYLSPVREQWSGTNIDVYSGGAYRHYMEFDFKFA